MRLVDATLLDCIKVCYDLPESEQQQITALGGGAFDPEREAVKLFNAPELFKFCAIVDAGQDDTALAVGGYVPLRQGVYRSYMLATNKAWAEYGRQVTVTVRRIMREMLKEHAHRLETVALANRYDACKWYSSLGMRCEGTLAGYGVGGEDAVVYAITRSKE